MKTDKLHSWSLSIACLLAFTAGPAVAQTVEVTSGGERVVVDGDTVRIEEPGGVTVVQGDWRNTGAVQVETDTEQILIDLGAVTVEDRIQLNLAGDILFDFDSASIRADAAAQLAKVAHVIRSRSVGDVFVIGHTDSIGGDAHNQKLSRDRATSVMQWLNRHERIPASIMVGSGMGAKRPVAHNTAPDGSDSPEGRAKNRRVEIQMATREGLGVGPDVVITPGGVSVTDEGVNVAGGAIQVDQRGVRVGGVQVTDEGVRIGGRQVVDIQPGGVTVSGDPSGVVYVKGERGLRVTPDRAASCATGDDCDFTCPDGDCRMRCEAGANCDFTCSGGDCHMDCKAGGNCEFTCSGGDCSLNCEPGGNCEFGCSGGDCRFTCPAGANCDDLSCSGEDCTCVGAAC